MFVSVFTKQLYQTQLLCVWRKLDPMDLIYIYIYGPYDGRKLEIEKRGINMEPGVFRIGRPPVAMQLYMKVVPLDREEKREQLV